MPPSFEIILVSLRPSFSDEGTFSVFSVTANACKTMERVDRRPRKLRFKQREKKPSRARVSGNSYNHKLTYNTTVHIGKFIAYTS